MGQGEGQAALDCVEGDLIEQGDGQGADVIYF